MSMVFCPKCGHRLIWLDKPCPNCGPHALMASASPTALGSDPDETAGRKLYRAKADTLALAQVNLASRKVKLGRLIDAVTHTKPFCQGDCDACQRRAKARKGR